MISRGERIGSISIGVLIVIIAIAAGIAIIVLERGKQWIFKPYVRPVPDNPKLILQE